MNRRQFEGLVEKALEGLPPEFRDRMENVAIVVEDWPSPDQIEALGLEDRMDLLGLYEGVPLIQRSRDHAWSTPDKITLFRMPIEVRCRSEEEVTREIYNTVYHEIAHHFGISDEELDRIEHREPNE